MAAIDARLTLTEGDRPVFFQTNAESIFRLVTTRIIEKPKDILSLSIF